MQSGKEEGDADLAVQFFFVLSTRSGKESETPQDTK
jgi:hypothetical protein